MVTQVLKLHDWITDHDSAHIARYMKWHLLFQSVIDKLTVEDIGEAQ